jgi:FlaA1/EpsC-like NDP-sugar epimerase
MAFLFLSKNVILGLRSVIVIEWALALIFIGSVRVLLRILKDHLIDFSVFFPFLKNQQKKKNLLIIGAGDAGEIVAREILRVSSLKYNIIGFIDDQENKIGQSIHQIPVLGTVAQIIDLAPKYNIEEAVIALPSAPGQVVRKIMSICKEASLSFKITPKLYDIIDGKISVNQLREVQIEDLLGREVIKTNINSISEYLSHSVVLVTGAGGSIGSELCRQVLRFNPKTLILLDHAENNLYKIDLELTQIQTNTEIIPVIADVKNMLKLRYVFEKYQPQVVFHAAAYKHVPLMEYNIEEVIQNNILGTRNLLELSQKFKINEFVLISTDKAVKPTNCMGASKRLCEVLMQISAKQDNGATKYSSVRFGNVLGSDGSVVPLFKQQISQGGPVTITHPEISRYFMTIPEAVSLVIQAGALCEKKGEIFILDMGDPVKITSLAQDMIQLSGFEVGKDIEIKYVGLRPGEKLYEELFFNKEKLKKTSHQKIFITEPQTFEAREVQHKIDQLLKECYHHSKEELKEKLLDLVGSLEP